MKMMLRNGSTYFSYKFYRSKTVSIIGKAGQSETDPTKQTERRKISESIAHTRFMVLSTQ